MRRELESPAKQQGTVMQSRRGGARSERGYVREGAREGARGDGFENMREFM